MDRPSARTASPPPDRTTAATDAFDLWLRQTLQHAHDTPAHEPVPEWLLTLATTPRSDPGGSVE